MNKKSTSNSKSQPIIIESSYYGLTGGTQFETTKASGPRGEYYDIVILFDSGDIRIGCEEGNYAGGLITDRGREASIRSIASLCRHDKAFKDMFLNWLTINNDGLWDDLFAYVIQNS